MKTKQSVINSNIRSTVIAAFGLLAGTSQLARLLMHRARPGSTWYRLQMP